MLYIIDSPFTMYILGFRQSYDKLVDTVGETVNVTTVYNGISTTTHNTGFLSATSTYYYKASTSTYNLNPDNFISMYIPQLSGCVLNMAGLNTTFKIPLNCLTGTTYYLQDHQNFKQINGILKVVFNPAIFNTQPDNCGMYIEIKLSGFRLYIEVDAL